MTHEELAARLNGREYRAEMTRAEEAEAKAAGLVVVFGSSDDLMEFRGAISDEVGAYEGNTVTVDDKGLLADFEELIQRPHKDRLRDYFQREGKGRAIEAVWDRDGYVWTYRTEIPHATFDIMEDGEKYCRGIVFALKDASQ